ncbi:MAG: hypothetical protein ABI460_07730 [Caldimonas sp.]
MLKAVRATFAAALIAASCSAAMAQAVRATIEKVDGNVLALKAGDGSELRLTLTENAMIVAVVKASMADIREGTFLGSAATPRPDGTQKALEVHIFPEQMRGAGEGHRPFAPVPNGTMTNGAATEPVVTGVDGHTIVVRYKDGEKKILIPPDVPIVRYEIGGKGDLKAGARVTVFAPVKKPDGTLEASRINVGRDGVVPQ